MRTPSGQVCPWAAWAVVAKPGAKGNCFRVTRSIGRRRPLSRYQVFFAVLLETHCLPIARQCANFLLCRTEPKCMPAADSKHNCFLPSSLQQRRLATPTRPRHLRTLSEFHVPDLNGLLRSQACQRTAATPSHDNQPISDGPLVPTLWLLTQQAAPQPGSPFHATNYHGNMLSHAPPQYNQSSVGVVLLAVTPKPNLSRQPLVLGMQLQWFIPRHCHSQIRPRPFPGHHRSLQFKSIHGHYGC